MPESTHHLRSLLSGRLGASAQGSHWAWILALETLAGRIALGSEVRIVLDAAPQFVIPAKVSFLASVAQFTPKTVETESERQKLMFRVKARSDPELLRQRPEQVKTGLPGVALVQTQPQAAWPARLAVKVAP